LPDGSLSWLEKLPSARHCSSTARPTFECIIL
jgi:hypothetical protein